MCVEAQATKRRRWKTIKGEMEIQISVSLSFTALESQVYKGVFVDNLFYPIAYSFLTMIAGGQYG